MSEFPKCDWCSMQIVRNSAGDRRTDGKDKSGLMHRNCSWAAREAGVLDVSPHEFVGFDVGSASICRQCSYRRDAGVHHTRGQVIASFSADEARAVVENVGRCFDALRGLGGVDTLAIMLRARVDVTGYLDRALGLVEDAGVMEKG